MQTHLTGNIDYALWHTTDKNLKAKNVPIGGSYHPLPTNKDMKVRVPSHPANTGSEEGLYGKPTRNLSETQLKHPPAVNATKRDACPGTTDYNLDPLGKAGTSPFLQSGTYRTAKNTTELPALACNWEWHHERDVPYCFNRKEAKDICHLKNISYPQLTAHLNRRSINRKIKSSK